MTHEPGRHNSLARKRRRRRQRLANTAAHGPPRTALWPPARQEAGQQFHYDPRWMQHGQPPNQPVEQTGLAPRSWEDYWVAKLDPQEDQAPPTSSSADSRLAPSTTRTAVGVPVAEKRLTDQLVAQVARLYPPGAGRSVYLIPEAGTHRGRPDVIVVHASPIGLATFASTGLRLPNPAAAHAITTTSDDAVPASITTGRIRRLRQEMKLAGWTHSTALRAARLIHFSVAIEAKVHDWRQGIRQVSHWGAVAHRRAVLMPQARLLNVPPRVLETYDIDLLAETTSGRIEVTRKGQSVEPDPGTRLWMLELLVREYFTPEQSAR